MAEEIGYSIIGEQEKQLSNVVDYNIRPEITKDTANVDNANNQTTTGMANIIPGINAPKLIASTSIIGAAGGGGALLASTAEYGISTAPGTSITKYDLESLSSPGGDLYIDSGDIHIDGGTYLIIGNCHVGNSNVTSTILDLRYYDENGYIGHIARWYGAEYTNGCVVFSFVPGNYVRLYVQLNYSTANSDIKIDFIKLS